MQEYREGKDLVYFAHKRKEKIVKRNSIDLFGIFFFVSVLLISCDSSSDKILGKWRFDGQMTFANLTITRSGNLFKASCQHGDSGACTGNYVGEYKNNVIKTGDLRGDIRYLPKEDKVFFCGKEFSRAK